MYNHFALRPKLFRVLPTAGLMMLLGNPSSSVAQNIVADPTGSQKISQPSGTEFSVNRFEKSVFADQYTSIQSAINALPSTGGVVYVPPGTYTGPTSIPSGACIVAQSSTSPPEIWSKFNGSDFNSFTAGPGSENLVKFTYGTSLTISDASQICISGVVLDFGGSGNLTIEGVSESYFNMAVVNTNTNAPALSFLGDSTNNYNAADNYFDTLIVEGGSEGLKIGSASGNAATLNRFARVHILADTQPSGTYTGVDFAGQCDTNTLDFVELWYTNSVTRWNGIVFNSSSSTADKDADNIMVNYYSETGDTPATSTSIVVNPSFGNQFTTGVLAGTTKIAVTNWSPNVSTFGWNRLGDVAGSYATQNSFLAGALIANAGTPSLFLQKAGATKWQIYAGGSNELEFNNGSSNVATLSSSGNFSITGTLSKAGGGFKIDDPLDPAHKYLQHSFVESPDMLDIYNGNVTTDIRGQASVLMPSYFEALNRDFRYQLTPIGKLAQVMVSREIHGGRFEIKTNKPFVRVSWQVTGIRHDTWANSHRLKVEGYKREALATR